jgi:microcystin-dependent protein
MKKYLLKTALATAVALPMLMVSGTASAGTDPYLGEISYVGFNFAPRGWAFCSGQILPITQNTALFALLGNTYGGDGRNTFGIPDMRGRVPIHFGRGPGLNTYALGEHGGTEIMKLTLNSLPAHAHAAIAVSTSTTAVNPTGATSTFKIGVGGSEGRPGGKALGTSPIYTSDAPTVALNAGSIETSLAGATATTTTGTTVTVNSTGASQGFPVMQPYTVLNCIIAMEGVFPPRP